MYTVKKIQRHGVTLFAFNAAEHQPEKAPHIAIVLRPTAQSIGLNPDFFKHVIRRAKLAKVTESVREFQFSPTDFRSSVQVEPSQTPGRGGVRPTGYQCLPLRKVEVLLNEIETNRLKNPQARAAILNLQHTIVEMIEHYYHDGAAVNEKLLKAKPELLLKLEARISRLKSDRDSYKKMAAKLTATVERLVGLNEENSASLISLSARIDQLEAVIARKNSTIRALGGKAVGNERQKNLLKEELVDTNEYVETLKNRVRTLKSDLSKAKSILELKRSGLSTYRSMVQVMRELFPQLEGTKVLRIPAQFKSLLEDTNELIRSAVGPAVLKREFNTDMYILFRSVFPEFSERDARAVFYPKTTPTVTPETKAIK